MRVTRTVSLWKNGFPVTDAMLYTTGVEMSWDQLFSDKVSKAVAHWIVEAMALPSLGMPDNCFTLILDGAPVPRETSEVFKRFHRDDAWQEALDLAYYRKMLPLPTWFQPKHRIGHLFEGFPRMLQEIVLGASFVRCNFPQAVEYDVDELVEQRSDDDIHEWKSAWLAWPHRNYPTTPPLAP
jgi:hypothetical protein